MAAADEVEPWAREMTLIAKERLRAQVVLRSVAKKAILKRNSTALAGGKELRTGSFEVAMKPLRAVAGRGRRAASLDWRLLAAKSQIVQITVYHFRPVCFTTLNVDGISPVRKELMVRGVQSI